MINEGKKAVKTVSLIVFATAFSKVLGLMRDMLMAHLYGGSAQNAAFATASRIPRDFFDIFLGAAVLGVFIPVYNSFDSGDARGERQKDEFANIFLNAVMLATGLLAGVGMIFSRQIIDLATPGYDEATAELAANLLRVLFPMIVFTGAVYTLTGILQSKGEFLAPALVSAASNLGVIVYFLFLNGYFKIYGLGAAYLVSWIIQLLTLVVPLSRRKYKYRILINFKNPAFIKSIKMSLPIMAGSWLVPFGMLIGQRFLSFSEFYINAFDYSTKLFLLATGILTYSICNYIFPKLAQSAGDDAEFAKIVKNGLSAACFVIVPVACLAYALRGEAVAILFGHGKFKETAGLGAETAEMFSMLAPAMAMFSAIEILNRVFYSKNLAKYPMMASLLGIAANVALCFAFMTKLKLSPSYVALAAFLCQCAAAAVLVVALRAKIKGIFDKKFLANILKIFSSSAILLIIVKILYYIIGNSAFEAGIFKNAMVVGLIAAVGACFYIAANMVFKTEETKVFLKMLKKDKG